MQIVQLLKTILGGVLGSIAFTTFLYEMPLIGAPRLNIFSLLSTIAPDYNWWAQPLEFVILGVFVFPFLFRFLLYDEMPGRYSWQKGLFWGLILWALRGVVVAPILGEGFFSLHDPHAMAGLIQTLAGHLLYGFVLGLIATKPRQQARVVAHHMPKKVSR